MKYWDELTDLESQLIKLEMLLGAVRTINAGVESSNINDVQNAFYFIEENLEEISKNAGENFQDLWEMIRADNYNEIEEEWTPEEVTESDDIDFANLDELTTIINSWVNKN